MAVKYVEVRKGVWKPAKWSPPKRVIDSKRLGEVFRKLLTESPPNESPERQPELETAGSRAKR